MLKLCFYFLLTSKWQTHLPYLQLETLLLHNYIIHYDFPGYHCPTVWPKMLGA